MKVTEKSGRWGIAILAIAFAAGCAVNADDVTEPGSDVEDIRHGGSTLMIGYSGWGNLHVFDNPRYDDIFTSSSGRAHVRLCHAYPRYDIALTSPPDPTRDEQRQHFQEWHDLAVADHCQISVVFKSVNQHHQTNSPKIVPTGREYEEGFLAFRRAWPDVHIFSTWNEPNNDNGAETSLTPHEAAEFYLRARRHCEPSEHCSLAAGDLASWHGWMGGVDMQCSRNNPDALCDTGSYLDQFKYWIDRLSEHYDLGPHFRPEYWGFHPWHDSFAYTENHSHCSSRDDCMTRAMLTSLEGSWRHSHLWATEVAVENPTVSGHSGDFGQACGAAFLMRLFQISPRIARVYYFDTGGLIDGNSPDTIDVLRDRTEHFSSACW